MLNLLKADFYRLLRDKAIYIMAGLAVLVALIMIGISAITKNIESVADLVSFDGRTFFLGGLSLGQNLGLLLILGTAIFVGKDFSQNTIRNKIIIGNSKTKIYLSNLIVSIVITLTLFLLYQTVVFAVGVPIFGWTEGGFDGADFARLLVNSFVILVALSATINLVSMLTRNMVAGILCGVLGTVLVVTIMASLLMIPAAGSTKDILMTICKTNLFGQSVLIGMTNSVSFMLWVIITGAVTVAGTSVLGCFLFEKLDIK